MTVENAASQPVPPSALDAADYRPIGEFCDRNQTAVLVIMFTDLKGSTKLAETKGEVYSQRVRRKHDAMLKEIVERDDAGRCIKNIGDALMCIFAEPSSAVERAVEIQETLAEFNRKHPDQPPIRVRVGIHMGQVVVDRQVMPDVFGRHVNRAARMESLAQAGRILVTQPVYDSASGWLAQRGLTWADHGYYRLKGIPEPARVYEVCTPSNPKPARPPGNRVRSKMKLALAVATLLLLAAVPAVWLMAQPGAPVQAELEVRVLREGGSYVTLAEAMPLQTDDRLQVVGLLSAPVRAALLWFDADGGVHVVASSGGRRVRTIAYPPDEDDWVKLAGSTGTEVLILVTSQGSLKEELELLRSQLRQRGPWPDMTEHLAMEISPDGSAHLGPRSPGEGDSSGQKRRELLDKLADQSRAPGEVVATKSRDPQYRAKRLRQVLHEECQTFQAIAFTHQ